MLNFGLGLFVAFVLYMYFNQIMWYAPDFIHELIYNITGYRLTKIDSDLEATRYVWEDESLWG